MRIKYIVSGVAVALAVSVGSASAADQFAILASAPVQPLSAAEMGQIRGQAEFQLRSKCEQSVDSVQWYGL